MPKPAKFIAGAALVCMIIGAIGLVGIVKAGPSAEPETIQMERKVQGDAVQNVSVTADVADLTLAQSPDSDIHIHYTGPLSANKRDNVRIEADTDGDSANIHVLTQPRLQIGIDIDQLLGLLRNLSRNKAHVLISLPDHSFRSAKFATNTGDIHFSTIPSGTLELSTNTGDITLDEYRGQKLAAHTNTGDVTIGLTDSETTARTDTGDIKLGIDTPKQPVTATSATGDIVVSFRHAGNLQFDCKTDVGKTQVRIPGAAFTVQEKHSINGIVGTGGPLIHAKTNTGDITLESE